MNSILTGSRAVVGVLMLAAASAAMAGTNAVRPDLNVASVEVAYTDLDLATTNGARALYKRIVHAAHTVCGPANPRSARIMSAYRECFREAVNGAVEEVGAPTLTTLHQDRAVRQASG